MDKPTSAKSQRKKGNKLVRRLLKWRENKSKTNQAVSDSKDAQTEDEEQWQRIKNMEQTRTISAMKNHIHKLQEKLDDLQKKDNNNKYAKFNGDGIAVRCFYETDKPNEDAKLRNDEMRRPSDGFRMEAVNTSESGEDILVFVEKENDPLEDVSAKDSSKTEELKETISGEELSYKSEKEQHSEAGNRLDSGLAGEIIDEINDDELGLQKCSKKSDEESEEDSEIWNDNKSYGIPEQIANQWSEDRKSQAPTSNSVEDISKTLTNLVLSSRKSSMKNDTNAIEAISQVPETKSNCDQKAVEEISSVRAFDASIAVESKHDSETDRNLEEVNAELKERVYTLEEQLWLAMEERRNIQAVLELQKERALKNLAFKFEDINRKTLREFKGIFEYRLLQLNEEKVKLQEKLDNHLCTKDSSGSRCKDCRLFTERLAASEGKFARLLDENDRLKRRCRKLNGDLGKVKKVMGLLDANDDTVGIDMSCQTDVTGKNRIDIGVQCEISLKMPLNGLREEIRDIATKVSVISSCLLIEQRKLSQGEELITDNDILNSVSSNNESGIESLQISPTRDCLDNGGFGDDSAVYFWQASEGNIGKTITDVDSEKASSCSHPVYEADSVTSGNSMLQLSINDIEQPLLRIHEKYTKISEELDCIAAGKMNSNASIDTKKANACIAELDPEIKKLVDEVNRKYDEYFKTESIF